MAEPAAPATTATEEDVRYCYRLLLEREPDVQGLAAWRRAIAEQGVSLHEVVAGFLQSPERRALEASRMEPERVELDGFRIWVRRADPQIGLPIARDRAYEPHLTARLGALLAPGAVFVDVGANVGFFTLLAATRVGAAGRVHAFEAREDNLALLRRSLLDNGLDNVEIHHCAVSDRAGSHAFFASGSWFSNGRIVADAESGSEQLPRVRTVALDDALAGVPRIDVIKMDIEGAEGLALAGMRRLLRRHRPVLFTEFSPDLLLASSGIEPRAYLEALGEEHLLHVVAFDADAEPASGPLTVEAVLARQAAARSTHLDLMAVPRARR
jgi:FkbM family methyltransferase